MAAVNKVILIGSLGRDPEMRKTPEGASVCSFSMATTEKFTDKQGNKQEDTEWHNIVAWNKSAETLHQYLKKGSSVYIEGKLKTQMWEDNGTKKYRTEIIVQQFQFIGGNGGGGGDSSRPEQNEPPMGFHSGGQPQQNHGGFGGGQQNQQQNQGGFGGGQQNQQQSMGGFGGGQQQQYGDPDVNGFYGKAQ